MLLFEFSNVHSIPLCHPFLCRENSIQCCTQEKVIYLIALLSQPDLLDQLQADARIFSKAESASIPQIFNEKAVITVDRQAGPSVKMPSQKHLQQSVKSWNKKGVTGDETVGVAANGSAKESNPLSVQKSTGLQTSLKDILKTANLAGQVDNENKQIHNGNTTRLNSSVSSEIDEDELDFLLSLDTPAERSKTHDHAETGPVLKQKQVRRISLSLTSVHVFLKYVLYCLCLYCHVIGVCVLSQSASEKHFKKKCPQTFVHLLNFQKNVSAMFDKHTILLC